MARRSFFILGSFSCGFFSIRRADAKLHASMLCFGIKTPAVVLPGFVFSDFGEVETTDVADSFFRNP
jgi:hypothetical protein